MDEMGQLVYLVRNGNATRLARAPPAISHRHGFAIMSRADLLGLSRLDRRQSDASEDNEFHTGYLGNHTFNGPTADRHIRSALHEMQRGE